MICHELLLAKHAWLHTHLSHSLLTTGLFDLMKVGEKGVSGKQR